MEIEDKNIDIKDENINCDVDLESNCDVQSESDCDEKSVPIYLELDRKIVAYLDEIKAHVIVRAIDPETFAEKEMNAAFKEVTQGKLTPCSALNFFNISKRSFYKHLKRHSEDPTYVPTYKLRKKISIFKKDGMTRRKGNFNLRAPAIDFFAKGTYQTLQLDTQE